MPIEYEMMYLKDIVVKAISKFANSDRPEEWLFGAENSVQLKKHLSQVEELLSQVNIIGVDYDFTSLHSDLIFPHLDYNSKLPSVLGVQLDFSVPERDR